MARKHWKNWEGKSKEMKMHGDYCNCWHCRGYGWKSGGGIYCLGFLGAAIYYLQNATGFWNGVLGVLKAIVWPAFLVYKLLGL